jgi:diguanylate cyclase (GGDEF)-like protein
MINENDQYISVLKEKLKSVEDHELVDLVNRLIEERMYLSETINIDPLTGLYNRRVLENVREVGTLILCDIDNFKGVNDTFGHDVGDRVLKNVGKILMRNVRVGDIICRFGGDEFLIIFSTTNEDVVYNRLNKIRDEVRRIIKLDNFDVTLSIGVASNDNNYDVDTLFKMADKALYQSKGNGKNQVTYYNSEKVKKIVK